MTKPPLLVVITALGTIVLGSACGIQEKLGLGEENAAEQQDVAAPVDGGGEDTKTVPPSQKAGSEADRGPSDTEDDSTTAGTDANLDNQSDSDPAGSSPSQGGLGANNPLTDLLDQLLGNAGSGGSAPGLDQLLALLSGFKLPSKLSQQDMDALTAAIKRHDFQEVKKIIAKTI